MEAPGVGCRAGKWAKKEARLCLDSMAASVDAGMALAYAAFD